MVASLPEALQKAFAEKEKHLSQVVGEWSADDRVHVDPPLQNFPTTPVPQEKPQVENSQATSAQHEPVGGRHPFHVTNNVTKTTFEYVRDNPGMRRADVIRALVAKGFKGGSVSSLIGQMVLQRTFHQDEDSRLSTGLREYQPLKSGAVRKLLSQARQLELRRSNPNKAAGYVKMAKTRAARRAAKANPNPNAGDTLEERRERTAKARAAHVAAAAARREASAESARKADAARKRAARAAARAQIDNAKTKGSGINIDMAHKMARPAGPNWEKSPMVKEIVQAAQTAIDLRGASAETIVEAMNTRQAKEVYKALGELFGAA